MELYEVTVRVIDRDEAAMLEDVGWQRHGHGAMLRVALDDGTEAAYSRAVAKAVRHAMHAGLRTPEVVAVYHAGHVAVVTDDEEE